MRLLYYMTKYAPVAFGIALTFHCYLLTQDIDCVILKEFIPFNWFLAIILMVLSSKFKLCIYHKLFVLYDFLLDMCIKAQRYGMFDDIGIEVTHAREFVLSLGVCIQFLLIYRIYGSREKSDDGGVRRD